MSNGKEVETGAEGSESAATLKQADAHMSMFETGIFVCAECERTGRVVGDDDDDQMFNLPCNPRKTSRARLAKLIRCGECAAEIAKRNQRRPGEPGCGVYYLRVTLPLLRSESEIAAEESKPPKPTPRQLQDQKDFETLQWVLESKQRREQEARQQVADKWSGNRRTGRTTK